jgi:hypothetical protein
MIDSLRCGRVILAVSVIAIAFDLSGCAMVGQKSAETSAQVHKVKTASVKKPANIAKVKPAKTEALAHEAADRTITASIAPDAPVVGRTWNYEYSGSRGTITYNADGTSSFNEPGLRKGAGKWHLRNGEFCQSFSGIQEPCTKLRQSGKAIYLGDMKLTQAQ